MSGLDLSHPHLEKVRYLLQPLDWAQAAPPWGAWGRLAGGGWAVCPSVSTHHRAQSLFPRLKPSQLKSSKPRVVGATPPPVEERDRCSREGGRGALQSLLEAHAPPWACTRSPSPPATAQGPRTARTRLGEDRRGTRQAEATPLVGSHPAVCSLPTALHIFAALGAGGGQSSGASLLSWGLP